MSRIIGIDLGTTNSLVASVDSGIPLVLADDQGQRLTPSMVYFPEPGQDPVVGEAARRQRVVHPSRTLYSVKRYMGRRRSEVRSWSESPLYPVPTEGEGPVTFDIDGKAWSPEAVSAEILKKLKADAERALEETVTSAVITVPAYFNDAQRNATKKAGELAGLEVERIINEPTAAALAYGLNRLKDASRIAVYDLGGGTFDLSILELKEGVFQVLATHGNTRLGGDDVDRCLVNDLVRRIQEADGPSVDGDLLLQSRIQEAAEQAKIQLSGEEETTVALPFLKDQFSFECRYTRNELEAIARPVIEKTREHCRRSLADAGLESKDLDQVILVGGQTRMPLVRRLVSEWFSCGDFEEERGGIRLGTEYHEAEGPQLNTSQHPDEAVALGAAIQGEVLSGGLDQVLLLDVTPLSLGIETFGGLMNVIIPRNSTIPTKAGEMFTTAVDHQKDMLIHVLQGERERARDNWSLGQFTIDFESAPRGVARVGVQFEIDANGILKVLVRDTLTQKEKIVEMKSAVDVEDADVQKMVEESVDHAFDDLAARQWIETRLRAEQTMEASGKGLEAFRDQLEADHLKLVELCLEEVQGILGQEDPATGSGDVRRLKEALSRLDEATRPLADLMMDQAMEDVLRKRGMIQ